SASPRRCRSACTRASPRTRPRRHVRADSRVTPARLAGRKHINLGRRKEQHMKAALYLQTNDAGANEAIAYARGADGQLERAGAYATGGKGSGKPHLASQASVVLHEDHLLVTN